MKEFGKPWNKSCVVENSMQDLDGISCCYHVRCSASITVFEVRAYSIWVKAFECRVPVFMLEATRYASANFWKFWYKYYNLTIHVT